MTDFASRVRDNGISYVLGVIAEYSHAFQDRAEDLNSLISALIESFAGKISIGNLNYNTLLLAGLLAFCVSKVVADMGHGLQEDSIPIRGRKRVTVNHLRQSVADFPDSHRVRLLHLHRSLTYWANSDESMHVKLPREEVERSDQ